MTMIVKQTIIILIVNPHAHTCYAMLWKEVGDKVGLIITKSKWYRETQRRWESERVSETKQIHGCCHSNTDKFPSDNKFATISMGKRESKPPKWIAVCRTV